MLISRVSSRASANSLSTMASSVLGCFLARGDLIMESPSGESHAPPGPGRIGGPYSLEVRNQGEGMALTTGSLPYRDGEIALTGYLRRHGCPCACPGRRGPRGRGQHPWQRGDTAASR